jgi:hypothetical protein
MKRFILLGVACIATLIFSGCANHSSRDGGQIQKNLEHEAWMQRINLDPLQWTKHASPWFYNSEPSRFDQYESDSPVSRAITAMTVRVPDFKKIHVDGPFKIQIVGRQSHNTVYILGPNAAARHAAVDIKGDTLYIHPATECGTTCGSLDQVIVRIGMRELDKVYDTGTGPFEAKNIDSTCLDLISTNTANILLVGDMTVSRISQRGNGTITIIGANTPALDIDVISNGNLNISGKVNVHHINKKGVGSLNIIGASSDGLVLKSAGAGITTIAGYTNLKKIDVVDSSRVYIYWINSNGIYINVRDNARLGLAGSAHNMDIEMNGNSRFLGKYLRVENVYIRTKDNSHANISPSDKLFANAMDSSSVYFFTSPNVISRYTMGNGVIAPIFNDSCPIPAPQYKGMATPASRPPFTQMNSPSVPYTNVGPTASAATSAVEPSYKNEPAWDKLIKG